MQQCGKGDKKNKPFKLEIRPSNCPIFSLILRHSWVSKLLLAVSSAFSSSNFFSRFIIRCQNFIFDKKWRDSKKTILVWVSYYITSFHWAASPLCSWWHISKIFQSPAEAVDCAKVWDLGVSSMPTFQQHWTLTNLLQESSFLSCFWNVL